MEFITETKTEITVTRLTENQRLTFAQVEKYAESFGYNFEKYGKGYQLFTDENSRVYGTLKAVVFAINNGVLLDGESYNANIPDLETLRYQEKFEHSIEQINFNYSQRSQETSICIAWENESYHIYDGVENVANDSKISVAIEKANEYIKYGDCKIKYSNVWKWLNQGQTDCYVLEEWQDIYLISDNYPTPGIACWTDIDCSKEKLENLYYSDLHDEDQIDDLWYEQENAETFKNVCDLDGFCTVQSLPVLPEDIETHPVFMLAVASAVIDQIVTTFKPVVNYVIPKMCKKINTFADMVVNQFQSVKARGFAKN